MTVAAVVAGVLSVQGCRGGRTGEAVNMAGRFVNAYFAADYDEAASLCGEELKAKVLESARQIGSLPDSLRSAFLELAEEMEPHTGDVYELGPDSVIVDFDILIPDEMEPMRNSVVVVRDRDARQWFVAEIR